MAEEETENKVGRPTDYKEEYAEQAKKLCQLGAVDPELADFFNVHPATIHRWKHAHPEFCESLKVGKEIADDRVERSLYQKAVGYDYVEEEAHKIKLEQHKETVEIVEVTRHNPADTNAIKFWLINRRRDNWRERSELDHTTKGKEMFAFNIRELDRDSSPDQAD